MLWITECKSETCPGNPDKTDGPVMPGPNGEQIQLDFSKVSLGHKDACPYCGCPDVFKTGMPECAEDVGTLRKEYNRRHAHEPGFVPSVEYIRDPNDPTKTIPKPEES